MAVARLSTEQLVRVVAVAIGLAILGSGLWNCRRAVVSGYWPTTPGTVESCQIEVTRHRGAKHGVVVDYSYEVGGVAYRGDVFAIGYRRRGGSLGRNEAQRLRDKLLAAKGILVRHNPNDPGEAVLSYGVHHQIRFPVVFGAFWTILALALTSKRMAVKSTRNTLLLVGLFAGCLFSLIWVLWTPNTMLLDNLQSP